MTWYLKPWCLPGEIMTDMYYPIYAEGLYDALMQVRGRGVCVGGAALRPFGVLRRTGMQDQAVAPLLFSARAWPSTAWFQQHLREG